MGMFDSDQEAMDSPSTIKINADRPVASDYATTIGYPVEAEPTSSPEWDNWLTACKSAESARVLDRAARYARYPAPVMIVGECGVGKRQLARHILASDATESRKVLRFSCIALAASHSSVESNWTEQTNRFAANPNVHWVIEHLDHLPLELQPVLLQFLELVLSAESRQRPRVISTCSPRVFDALENGRLLEELFYKLFVLDINVTPLRERPEEIPNLIDFFVKSLCNSRQSRLSYTPEAIEAMSKYNWPGNVLELRNLISKQFALCREGAIDSGRLRQHLRIRTKRTSLDETTLTLEDAETQIILDALERCNGNKTEAAAQLGIATRTLHNKITKYRRQGLVA